MTMCQQFGWANSQECAAWVQAWGSVGAILIAAISLWVQQWLEGLRRRRDKAESRTAAVSLAYQLVNGAEQAARSMAQPGYDDRQSVDRKMLQADAFSRAFSRLDLATLNSFSTLEPVLVTHLEIEALLLRMRRTLEDPTSLQEVGWALFREDAAAATREIEKRAATLHKELATK